MGISIIRTSRRQKGVYWDAPTSDGSGGTETSLPVEIDCRFEQGLKLVKTANGEERMSVAQVNTDRDCDTGGFLILGTLDSLNGKLEHTDHDGAREIIMFEKLPVLRVGPENPDPALADEFLRTAFLG